MEGQQWLTKVCFEMEQGLIAVKRQIKDRHRRLQARRDQSPHACSVGCTSCLEECDDMTEAVKACSRTEETQARHSPFEGLDWYRRSIVNNHST